MQLTFEHAELFDNMRHSCVATSRLIRQRTEQGLRADQPMAELVRTRRVACFTRCVLLHDRPLPRRSGGWPARRRVCVLVAPPERIDEGIEKKEDNLADEVAKLAGVSA